MERPVGWGVVGIGNIVTSTIAPAIVAEPHCRLVAATSRDQSRADRFVRRFAAERGYSDYAQMLADPEVDAVYVATPNALHASQVIAAARAGKAVLCDKPLGLSAAEAVRAAEECVREGVPLGVNFHNRYLPWVRDVTEMIGAGAIGAVELVEVEVGSGRRSYDNWRSDPTMAGLGTVNNVGVHALDFLTVLLSSEPAEVMAMFDVEDDQSSVEMLALIVLRFDSGVMAYVNCNEVLTHPRNEIAIHGTRGRITGVGFTRSREDGMLTVRVGDRETRTPYPAPQAHRLAVAAFARAVREGCDPDPSGADGVRSARVSEAIARSAQERRRVRLDEIAMTGLGT